LKKVLVTLLDIWRPPQSFGATAVIWRPHRDSASGATGNCAPSLRPWVGQEFCFNYMFKTIFLNITQLGDTKISREHCPRISPFGYGPG